MDYIELDTDGEEVEYAEFTVDELLREQASLKAQLDELAEDFVLSDPDRDLAETE